MTVVQLHGVSMYWDNDNRRWAGPDAAKAVVDEANATLDPKGPYGDDPDYAATAAFNLHKQLGAKILKLDEPPPFDPNVKY